jgi:hypothetical protein
MGLDREKKTCEEPTKRLAAFYRDWPWENMGHHATGHNS